MASDADPAPLIEASRHAQLIVVGARGRGSLTGLFLGSVSQAILHHAACPVAIIPPQPPPTSRRRTQVKP